MPQQPSSAATGVPSVVQPSIATLPGSGEVVRVESQKPAEAQRDLSAPQQGAAQTPLQQALECLSRGDNHCVIRALEDKASTPREIELLIATYRTVGDGPRAEREMKHYIDSFPTGPRVPEYKSILERHGPGADPADQPRP
jgi:hypothetical protein